MEKMHVNCSHQLCKGQSDCTFIKSKRFFLLVPLCCVVLLGIQSNCLSNYWMTMIASEYQVPKESDMFQFDVIQMNSGSGDWWIYGQDDANYYFFLGYDSLPYIVFSRNSAQQCTGFSKRDIDTWCGIDTSKLYVP